MLTTSVSKVDIIPNMWLGLYIVASLKSMRFWSTEPPRTLMPVAASPTDLTPGRVITALMTSDSPNAAGRVFIKEAFMRSTPIAGVRCLDWRSACTTAPLSEITVSFIITSRLPSP